MKKLTIVLNITAIVCLFASPLLAMAPDEDAEKRMAFKGAQLASASANAGQGGGINGGKSKKNMTKRLRSSFEISSGTLELTGSDSGVVVSDRDAHDSGGGALSLVAGSASVAVAHNTEDGGAADSGSGDGEDGQSVPVSAVATHNTGASGAAGSCSGSGSRGSGSREDNQIQRASKRARLGQALSRDEPASFSVTVAAPAASSSAAIAPLPADTVQQQYINRLHALAHNLSCFPPGLQELTLSYLVAGSNYKSLISRIQAGLEEFDISHHFLGDDFANDWASDPALLHESYLLRSARVLLLNDNFFSDDSLESLRRIMGAFFSLRWLNISNNRFGRFLVLDVARELEHLDLSGNRLTDAGMRELFKQGPRGRLITLCLHDNCYGDQGANWLFWLSAAWQIQHLSVEGRNLTQKGIITIQQRLPKSVQFLVITGVKDGVINQLNTVFKANQRNVRVANVFSAETMGLPSLLPPPRTPRLDSIMQSVSHGERLDIGAAATPACGHKKQMRSLTLLPPLASE